MAPQIGDNLPANRRTRPNGVSCGRRKRRQRHPRPRRTGCTSRRKIASWRWSSTSPTRSSSTSQTASSSGWWTACQPISPLLPPSIYLCRLQCQPPYDPPVRSIQPQIGYRHSWISSEPIKYMTTHKYEDKCTIFSITCCWCRKTAVPGAGFREACW